MITLLAMSLAVGGSAQDTEKTDSSLVYRPRGTGRTTGHIITLSVHNRSADSAHVQIGPCLIPSTGRYQGYVVNRPQDVTVPPLGKVEVALSGYCTNVFKPAVPDGATVASVEDWTFLEESAPIPWAARPLSPGFTALNGAPVDSVWLTYPGTDVPFPYKIDFDEHPESATALLIQVVNEIERTVEELAPLLSLPGGEWAGRQQTVVQQVFWQYTARLAGGLYPFAYFRDRLEEQVSVAIEQPQAAFSEARKEELTEAGVDFWSAFELVGVQAKLTIRAGDEGDWPAHYRQWIRTSVDGLRPDDPSSLEKWRALHDTLTVIDTYLDRETSGYAGRILRNKFQEVLQFSFERLYPGNPDFTAHWQKMADLTATGYFPEYLDENTRSDIRRQLEAAADNFLQTQTNGLDPAAPDFLSHLETLQASLKTIDEQGFLSEATRRQIGDLLPKKMRSFLEEQLRALETGGEDRLQSWLDLIHFAQTDLFWDYLNNEDYDRLERRLKNILQAELSEQAQRLDPANDQMLKSWFDLIYTLQVDWISDFSEPFRRQIEDALADKLMAYLQRRIDQLDAGDPAMFRQWLDLIWLLQVDFVYDYLYLKRDANPVEARLRDKVRSFLTRQIDGLDPAAPDFMSQWAALERALNDDWIPNYLTPEERDEFSKKLAEKFSAALWRRTNRLNPGATGFINPWRAVDQWTKTHWFDEYLAEGDKARLNKALRKGYRQWEKTQSKTLESQKVDWAGVQISHPAFKIPIVVPSPFPVWIPLAGGAVVTGGILLLTGGDETPAPEPPVARDDEFTVPCNSPANLSVLANDSGEGLRITAVTAPPGIEVNINDGSLQMANTGAAVFPFSYTVTDQNGETAVATVTVFIEDDLAPTLVCPADLTVDCSVATAPASTGQATAEDNCDPSPAVAYTDATAGTACEPVITRVWRASDQVGNLATCTQLITLVDEQAPVINCPADAFVSTEEPRDPPATGQAAATDNCSPAPELDFSDDESGLDADGLGELFRTWTAADACGQTHSCTQTITITQSVTLEITCPADITISCEENSDPAATGEANLEGDCPDGIELSYADEATVGTCPGEQVIQRTWKGTDVCGNETECTQVIAINDETGPQLTCPAAVTVTLAEELSPQVTGQAAAADDCSPPEQVSLAFEDATGGLTGCAGTGTIRRTWTATDGCGNTRSCMQEIRVVDDEPPEIICPFPATANSPGQAVPEATGMATAMDNASTLDNIVIAYEDDLAGLDGCGGVLLRTWTATDACGNVSVCVQEIVISDMESPVVNCPAPAEVGCGEADDLTITGIADATDNYTSDDELIVQFIDNQDELTTCGGGDILRLWFVVDACGNTGACEQLITVRPDDTAPALVCPPDIQVACGEQNDIALTGAATATDNCSADATLNFSDDVSTLSGCEGFITRTWNAIDPCGNTTACEQVIHIDAESGCIFYIVLETDQQPSSPTSTDGSVSLLVSDTDLAFPLDIYLNDEFIFRSEGGAFTISELGAGIYEVYAVDQDGCRSAVFFIQLVAPGGIQAARSGRSTFVYFPILVPSYLSPPGVSWHGEGYDYDRARQFLQRSLPEHPGLASVPDFEYYTGPATGVGLGYRFAPGTVLRVDLAQVGAVGLSRWTLPDATPVYWQSAFRMTQAAWRLRREWTWGRLSPYLGLSGIWDRLEMDQSEVLLGRQRVGIPDNRIVEQWRWALVGGLNVSLSSKVEFEAGVQWSPQDPWSQRFGLLQMLNIRFTY